MTAGATAVPEAVTFDYWNTLCYEPNMDQRRGLLAESWGSLFADAGVGVTAEELVAAYDAARAEYWKAWNENRQFTGTDAAHHCLQALAARTSLDHLTDALVDAFHGCSERAEIAPVAGVATVLESLQDAGVRVGIVCDVGLMASPYLRGHLERLGLLGYFRHWSFSDEVGTYKPDRRIFEHALDGLGGVVPARSVHVGDRRRTDIRGAQDMGMRAIRITTVYDDDDDAAGPSGDAVIARYDELLPLLGL